MAGVKTEIETILQGLQREDPRLYNIVKLLSDDLQKLQDQINPIELKLGLLSQAGPESAIPVDFVIFAMENIGVVRFFWAAGDLLSRQYEIRKGTDWPVAEFVGRTSNLSFDADPIPVGTHDYLLKSINASNNYSSGAAAASITIGPIGPIVITAQVIDNNVLLRWNTPTSTWRISHYELYRDSDFIGLNYGNFTAIFEQVSGVYTYRIRAVDIAGGLSDFGEISANVNQPPDFEFFAEFPLIFASSTFVNAAIQSVGLYLNEDDGLFYDIPHVFLPLNITETWQSHFTSRAWSTPQDQIDAGYPLFIEPTVIGTGYIETKVHLGTLINSIIGTVDWTQTIVVGNVTLACQMSWSTDDITYSTPVVGVQAYIPSAEWVIVRLSGTAIDDVSLADIADLRLVLSVKRENDGGVISALSTDATGTQVNFNKPFLDIDSLTGTAIITEGAEVVFDFVDVPNPTGFKVYVFDYAGQRISCSVRWAARGIVQV